MLKRSWFLALLLCVALLLVACDTPSAKDGNMDSEPFLESEKSDSQSAEIEQTEDSSAESESDEKLNVDEASLIYAYDILSYYHGVIVRWGDVIEQGDGVYENFVPVEVEVIDTVERSFYEAWSLHSEALALEVIYLPNEALTYVSEGEEALVFLKSGGFLEDETGRRWLAKVPYSYRYTSDRYPTAIESGPFPIFRWEEGCMIIDEKHMATVPERERQLMMEFMRYARSGNNFLKKFGDDERYYFRSGMTLEELEQYFYLIRYWRTF